MKFGFYIIFFPGTFQENMPADFLSFFRFFRPTSVKPGCLPLTLLVKPG
jgi:hypothetical protein